MISGHVKFNIFLYSSSASSQHALLYLLQIFLNVRVNHIRVWYFFNHYEICCDLGVGY